MDKFTPAMLDKGLMGMIGKGRRGPSVKEAMRARGAVYFLAPAGCGAYLSDKVVSCEIAAFGDLGPEAIYKLTVRDFPVIVGIDTNGKDIY
jgi:fumarate hydratase subunit beta